MENGTKLVDTLQFMEIGNTVGIYFCMENGHSHTSYTKKFGDDPRMIPRTGGRLLYQRSGVTWVTSMRDKEAFKKRVTRGAYHQKTDERVSVTCYCV